MQQRKQSFRLPMTLTFLVWREGEKSIAHSLDFDIVAVADMEAAAMDELRLAVKSYVEFGLSNGWREFIVCPAPQEFWDAITPDTPAKIGPPITVDDETKRVVVVEREYRQAA